MIRFILNQLILDDKFIFQGSLEELKLKVSASNSNLYELEYIGENELKFSLSWSISTGTFPDIQGTASVNEIDNKSFEIHLKTDPRPELPFIILLYLGFFLGFIFIDEWPPFWFYLLLPLTLIWFWGIIRIQEKYLFKKVKQYLTS